jgi:hypothetical protein
MNVKLSKGISAVNFLLRKRKGSVKERGQIKLRVRPSFIGIGAMFAIVNYAAILYTRVI